MAITECFGRYTNDRNTSTSGDTFQFTDMAGRPLTIQNRHMGIHQDRIIVILLEGMHGLATIGDDIDNQSITQQQAPDHVGINLVILGNKNATTRKNTVTSALGNLAAPMLMPFRSAGFKRQPHIKSRSLALGTIDLHEAAHQFRQTACNRKTKPRSTILPHGGIVGLAKGGKYLFLTIPRNSDAGIDNGKMVNFLIRNQVAHPFRNIFLPGDFQPYRSLPGEFHCI